MRANKLQINAQMDNSIRIHPEVNKLVEINMAMTARMMGIILDFFISLAYIKAVSYTHLIVPKTANMRRCNARKQRMDIIRGKSFTKR